MRHWTTVRSDVAVFGEADAREALDVLTRS
jgi:hypothetical protein